MPTISMFYGMIIRMYFSPRSILHPIFTCITAISKQRLIYGHAK